MNTAFRLKFLSQPSLLIRFRYLLISVNNRNALVCIHANKNAETDVRRLKQKRKIHRISAVSVTVKEKYFYEAHRSVKRNKCFARTDLTLAVTFGIILQQNFIFV